MKQADVPKRDLIWVSPEQFQQGFHVFDSGTVKAVPFPPDCVIGRNEEGDLLLDKRIAYGGGRR